MPVRETPWPAGTPCWVQLMTTDPAAAREFYGELFGWQTDPDNGMASLQGHHVAGISDMMGMNHPPVWSTYISVTDIEASVKAVEDAGGSSVAPVTGRGDLGRMAFVQAPGGGVFGLWQAGTHVGAQLANETGSLVWNEFMGRDYEANKAFYAKIFGYTYTEMGDGGFQYATIEVAGNIVGGIGELPAEVPPHWRVYFAVDDCDASVARVTELGGAVHRPPADMPYGRHADVADPQGAMFSLIKPASPE